MNSVKRIFCKFHNIQFDGSLFPNYIFSGGRGGGEGRSLHNFLKLNFSNNKKCINLNNFGHKFTREFRQIKRSPEKENNISISNNPPNPFISKMSNIFKPFVFTAFIGTGCFIGCAIWQYENYRSSGNNYSNWFSAPFRGSSAKKDSFTELREKVQNYWINLPSEQKIFWPICAANVLVWAAWRVPALSRFMLTFFSANPASKIVCSPMLLSTFSHFSLTHLAVNMFVLHSFMPSAVHILGPEQFLGFYLTSGVIASLGSHVLKVFTGNITPSLGASGAIMGMLGLVCSQFPNLKLGIVFIPGLEFSADTALKCIIAVDLAGIIIGWRFLDHAAHLSGCLFGVAYCKYFDLITSHRRRVMEKWHDYRTQR